MMENNIKDLSKGFEYVCKQSEAQDNCPMTYIYDFDDIKNNIYIKDKYWENVSNDEFERISNEFG